MSYSPDPLGHSNLSDRSSLWCSKDGTYCREQAPCPCCAEPEAAPEPAAEPEDRPAVKRRMADAPEVHLVSDGDTGEAGESTG